MLLFTYLNICEVLMNYTELALKMLLIIFIIIIIIVIIKEALNIYLKYFEGVSKVDDENKDKTLTLVCDHKEASCKWTRARKLNTKWQAGGL